MHPDIGNYLQNRTVTVVGEGFQTSTHLTLRVGDELVCGLLRDQACLASDVVIVDEFTVIATVPGYPEEVAMARLDSGSMFGVKLRVAVNGQDFSNASTMFYYTRYESTVFLQVCCGTVLLECCDGIVSN